MINFEEELKKFEPILEVEMVESEVRSRELADIPALLKELMEQNKPARKEN
ncbi:MAG: hypothetical protein SPL15_05470 [Lachnospiraceae bacterium]|nr:hypothetical protein [Lachnospiraceae bacterium]MDY5742428.1 hypothetical protein [Lachnospiraceae bacterium]